MTSAHPRLRALIACAAVVLGIGAAVAPQVTAAAGAAPATAPAGSPVGWLDVLARGTSPHGNDAHIKGWGFDPNSPHTALSAILTVDGTARTLTANVRRDDVGKVYPSAGAIHGFDTYLALSEGMHDLCVTLVNISTGANTVLGCRYVLMNFTPSSGITAAAADATGVTVSGWATDPDTTAATSARVTVNGTASKTVTANAAASIHSGHSFTASVPLRSGTWSVCVVGVNAGYGTHDSKPACKSVTLTLSPIGHLDTATRVKDSTSIAVVGWAADPDATSAMAVRISVDGVVTRTISTTVTRPDVVKVFPGVGTRPPGFAAIVAATSGEHKVCATAADVGAGSDRTFTCRLVYSTHPTAPSAPRTVTAVAGYGKATVAWVAPTTDGGAPVSGYTVRSSGGQSVTAVATARSATVVGLASRTSYTFTVTARNPIGTSGSGTSAAVTTAFAPPPQTTPAKITTSRYIRNVSAATTTDLARMRAEGAVDAAANPSGHNYLMLLDIGGQDQSRGGVLLSATAHYVSYPNLVTDLKAYIDGYHGAQKTSAYATIAVGTNNDVDVYAASGKSWADLVIDPLRAYAAKYPSLAIVGANDIEPGFSATYTETKAWLTGYLAATSSPLVFNGSADGCAWTVVNRSCNNGWTMAGLQYLAGGAAPTRILNLPQVYNNTMAAQWKYISLTGVTQGKTRLNFGGPLTEYTACAQAHSCGSLTGNSAWTAMWNNLQSDPRLKVASLPYSTDLRIDS